MAPIATIPTIPLSPVAKAWLVCRTNLEQADTALSKAKSQNHPAVSVSVLRKLIEDVKVERHRHDNLGRQMQSVQGATAFNWTPDVLAKQIAVIDCQLFGMVRLEKASLCQMDFAQTNLDRMLDFHHYLTNSFAHQLIFWASLTKPSAPTTATDTVTPPIHPKDNMISHLVQVAHALLHTYRDLSGFAAIMKALMLPQVRRLRSLWKNCPSRIKEMYGEMSPILSPDHHYQAYHNVLCQKLSYFFFTATSPPPVTTTTLGTSSIDRMVVIPWMQPHLISVRSIVTDYAAISGDHATLQQTSGPSANNSCDTSNIELVLSAPGLQKLAVVMALLEQCQTCPASSSLATDFVSSSSSLDILEDYMRPWRQDTLHHPSSSAMLDGVGSSSSGKRSRRQSMIPSVNTKSGTNISLSASSPSSITTISDLHTLFPGDLLVHHWMVSRVYLRKDQLVDESIQVQPLLDGEQLVCDTYSPDDVAIADIVAKKVSLSRAVILDKSDSPSSPVISASFAGWKTTTKSEPVAPASLHDNNISSSNGLGDDNEQEQKEKQHQSDDNNDDHDNDGNNYDNLRQANEIIDKGATTSEIQDDSNSVPQPPATCSEKDQLVNPTADGAILDDVEQTKADGTCIAMETTHTTNLTTESCNGNDDIKQLDTKNGRDDPVEHTLKTGSTLASTSASASASTSISSVSVVIVEEKVESTKLQPLNESDENITNKANKKQEQLPLESNNGKSGKKSKLSPTAPEFVPLLAQPTGHQHENMPSSVAVTPSSSVHNGSVVIRGNEEKWGPNNKKRNGYIPTTGVTIDGNPVLLSPKQADNETSSEDDDEWNGYPTPALEETQHNHQQQSISRQEDDDDDDEEVDDDVWTGYPGPPQRRNSLQSVLSDEWKGYHAAKMEARWELETALKVQQHEWQGYALEALNGEVPDDQ